MRLKAGIVLSGALWATPRRDFGHMDIQITIDDPVMYTKPWHVPMQKRLIVDDELIEWMCENEKDMIHMVGR